MPRLSDETWNQRRRQVLLGAWTCFSRDGFHATSMDDVIAASGMSASAVYRYFRSKDELIDATVDEALSEAEALFAELLTAEPPPGPAEVVDRLVGTVRERRDDARYDLSRLAMQAWTEGLRRSHLSQRLGDFYATVEARFRELAQIWVADGTVAPDSDPAAVARLFTTLLPGLVVMDSHGGGVDSGELVAGLRGVGGVADRTRVRSRR